MIAEITEALAVKTRIVFSCLLGVILILLFGFIKEATAFDETTARESLTKIETDLQINTTLLEKELRKVGGDSCQDDACKEARNQKKGLGALISEIHQIQKLSGKKFESTFKIFDESLKEVKRRTEEN